MVNPFDETMMAGMNVPKRPTMIDVAGPGTNYNQGYGPYDVTVSDIPTAYDNRWRQGHFANPDFGPTGGPPGIVPNTYNSRWQLGHFSNPDFGPAGGLQSGTGIFGGGHRRVGDAAGMVNDILPPEYDISQTGNPSTDWKTLESKILEIENNNPGIDPAETQQKLMEWLANQQKRVI